VNFPEAEAPPAYIVALVASLGGLHALGTVLGGLPRDLTAPVVVMQHVLEGHQSHLAALLDRGTGLAVSPAVDGRRVLCGSVSVAAPGSHLEIEAGDHCRFSQGPRVQYVRPSADILLRSMAASCGPRVLAVILTGKGSDGAAGAAEVRRCGGYVIAQEPSSSLAGSMPAAAIYARGVDAVLRLEEIAAGLLGRISGNPPTVYLSDTKAA
jgi:two-component system, chemotaxis family, protein-glutamate methylesterase/glutaminase